jgi:hypothetical protein
MTSLNTVLRYTPGQDYVFVHCKFRRFTFENGGKKISSAPMQLSTYRPWDTCHHLMNLEAVKLKCVEHHKVAWDQDPDGEAKYDGFVFESYEKPTRRWFNQYPRASYGQVSDVADRFLYLDWVSAGMTAKELIAVEATDKGMTELHDGAHFLANIRRGRVKIAKSDWSLAEKKDALTALEAFEVQVHEFLEKAACKKLRVMQVMYEPAADGKEPVLMDWFDVVFDDEPEYLHNRWEDGRGERRVVTPVPVEGL